MAAFKELQHEYDTTRGLCRFDRNPAGVDYDWIKKNAFSCRIISKVPGQEPGLAFSCAPHG
jgi:hypothetical protein